MMMACDLQPDERSISNTFFLGMLCVNNIINSTTIVGYRLQFTIDNAYGEQCNDTVIIQTEMVAETTIANADKEEKGKKGPNVQ